MDDFLTEDGANALAGKIRAYWKERGETVVVRVEKLPGAEPKRIPHWAVRSDLINGMPVPTLETA